MLDQMAYAATIRVEGVKGGLIAALSACKVNNTSTRYSGDGGLV